MTQPPKPVSERSSGMIMDCPYCEYCGDKCGNHGEGMAKEKPVSVLGEKRLREIAAKICRLTETPGSSMIYAKADEVSAILKAELSGLLEAARARELLLKHGFTGVVCAFDGERFYECKECRHYEGHDHSAKTQEQVKHKSDCKLAAAIRAIAQQGQRDCQFRCMAEGVNALCSIHGNTAQQGQPPAEGWKTKFEQHTAHVQEFLQKMYALMVDPVEESGLKVSDLCALLLKRAEEDREELHNMGEPVRAAEGECGPAGSDKPAHDVRLEEIRARAEKATPGPWTPLWVPSGMPTECCKFGAVGPDGLETVRIWNQPDVEFVAAARTDIPYLLDLHAAQGGRIAELALDRDEWKKVADWSQARIKELEGERGAAHQAFVAGAKWWEFESTGGTMWPSDQAKVCAEAEKQWPYMESFQLNVARSEAQALREALEAVLKSAFPNPKEHPGMWAAWKKAEAALQTKKAVSK